MVRRTARDCHDLPTLYQRLGEQITQQSAREAFMQKVVSTGSGSGSGGDSGNSGFGAGHSGFGAGHSGFGAGHSGFGPGHSGFGAGPGVGPAASDGIPVSDGWLERAVKLMAGHVGPIAKVVVKRAADRTRQREALCAMLVEAAPEAARAKLLADLAKLA
jgi:serine/threonine-protein kinase